MEECVFLVVCQACEPLTRKRALSPLQGDTKFCPSLDGRLLFVVSVAGDTSLIKKGCNFPYNYDKI